MSGQSPVLQALNSLGLSYRVFRHTGQVTSLEQAARERGQAPGQVVRSILFRLGEGKFVMVLAAGPRQVSWAALREYLKQSRLTLATETEVLAVTGYRVGTVSPLGLPAPMRILADENVFYYDEISFGSGEPNVGVIMKSADLRRALPGLEVGKFVQDAPDLSRASTSA